MVRFDNNKQALDAPLAEVLDALRGEDIVVPLPRELGLDEALGGEALEGLDHLQIRHIQLLMLRRVEVFLCN
jgi:hypothetical protein